MARGNGLRQSQAPLTSTASARKTPQQRDSVADIGMGIVVDMDIDSNIDIGRGPLFGGLLGGIGGAARRGQGGHVFRLSDDLISDEGLAAKLPDATAAAHKDRL